MAVNILLSYAYHYRTDLHEVRKKLICGRLMIDSGAFTAHSTGGHIGLGDYAKYLLEGRGAWDQAVTLDVIGDPAASRANTRILHGMGLPVMPVFTRGENLKEFDAMVKDSGYVCVGGAGGMSQPALLRRVALLQQRAADLGGGVHALGMGAIAHLIKAKPYSSDASNISGAFRFGTIMIFDGRAVRGVGIRDKDKMRENLGYLHAHGVDVAGLIKIGRMPTASEDGTMTRAQLMGAMGLAYAAADEYLHGKGSPPVPKGVNDNPGTHLFSAIPNTQYLKPTIELDWKLHHDPEFRPAIWTRYGKHHRCHPGHGTASHPDTTPGGHDPSNANQHPSGVPVIQVPEPELPEVQP